jgi:nitrite reductase/ring-hydroxylating ferredoxin subunit/alkylhydroperoxidase/carboxymuconolactone decarboxylase family protein YurZ
MSDALTYLVKTRPEAMGSYFKFLKEAGKHLDPKTLALISVISKVAVQTKPGFRQYLSRALREGATPNEILDALLIAFPILGLAKIVWAVDILLTMDIPEFRPEALDQTATWHAVADDAQVPLGETSRHDVADRSVFVYRTAAETRVYDSRCPHQVTNIPHLALQGNCLTCPKHEWVFDITTGACIAKGTRPLKHFASEWRDGVLYAYW